ncbi:MAG: bifunctional diaminohydroxyphosphoribosylaminopyrimidine deaminase/5-amino-6-(5-phosphoribosylamino)uracil reductase RibD [Aquificae bacterium]|nr:bifunctional diaminohydroxyphosphoribosylaminopyrimidine deaminase/5-amino-6-(5-phosphoribosylamino)uracil reductase RibD [Aquificota bacterium]
MDKDTFFMREALKLAKKRKGLTHPNPTVGAVIVKDGKIIGKGYHEKAGKPHAEREAIKDALEKGYDISGSTMYVTLEPCCHYGRTPPCTEAIIDSRIKRVVIATLDPNPQVASKGVEILRKQGIEVKTGVLENEAKELNEDFFVYITEKRPFVHLKIAQSLDGKIATYTGSSKWITGEKARKYAHKLRKEATAVMVGVGTAIADNPSLTVRHIKTEKQPKRILIDKDLKTPADFNIFSGDAETIVITSKNADKGKIKLLEKKGIRLIFLPLVENRFRIEDILDALYKEEIVHLLVEGGKNLITQFIHKNMFDRISLFIAPKIIGEEGISSIGKLGIEDINQAIKLKRKKIKTLGEDVLMQFSKQ